MKIQPMYGRILVRMIPVTADEANPLKLTLVDKKKHFDHASRRGTIEAIGRGVRTVVVGDVVVFRGDAGFTLDYDSQDDKQLHDSAFRWLKESDCLAVEEKAVVLEAV